MDDFKIIFDFFIWFRANGEQCMGNSIEKMIEIYLNEKNDTTKEN